MAEEHPQEGSSTESWNEARRIAALVANVSALFTTAIRFLKKDADAGSKNLSHSSLYCLQRLLNSASFKAPVYYGALCFKPDKIPQGQYLSARDLANLFSPDELANFIGLLYLYRRIQRGCDEAEWEELAKLIHLHGELGGIVGRALTKVGLGRGLLFGSIRHMSLGLFLGVKKKEYIQYRRNLKIKKVVFDLDEEMKIWGCNHLQVASMLIQSLQLGGSASKGLTGGLLLSQMDDKQIDEDAYRARVTWKWLEAMRDTGAPPDITHRGDYYPLKAEIERLAADAARIKEQGGCTHPFFAKGKEDLSPSLTPCLFEKHEQETEGGTEDVEKEVLEQFADGNAESEEI